MDIDFSALASRVAAFGDVLGCLILSSEGLVLGSFPPGDEEEVKPAWLRFAAIGEPHRGFIEFSDGEVWAYLSVGPYAAFAVAAGGTRPGILLDHLEQALLVASESRDRRQMARAPERVDLATRRPKAVGGEERRSSSPTRKELDEALEAFTAASSVPADLPTDSEKDLDQGADDAAPSPDAEEPPEGPNGEQEGDPATQPDGEEVDRVVLAREFAHLLQEDLPDDEEPT